ncbi:Hsp70 family protein [Desulfotomaculum nigrificans]|uniref:Hsp70 family protein n=1 Tax=Desulfotomaculum nigrificans TaxID=1565 RepID=UPI0001FAEB2E|nr:Hsp70 family protein [Desulfotomaculum nigrificans]
MKFDFGIDFGTTNSACTGIIDGKSVMKFEDQYDGSPFPSLVVIDPVTGKVECGREAWLKRQEYSENCEVISSVKTLLGTGKTWTIAGKNWTTEMIAAEVFKGLKRQIAAAGVKEEMSEAVVAVPVGFPPVKRAELRRAARLAGIEIKSFVSEPTAAFFRHYDEVGFYNKIAVFDWGGGTLDVAVLENSGGLIKEAAAGGLYLGGDDIDLKIAHWVHNQVIKQKKATVSFDEMPSSARDMMIARCERAKRDLSVRDMVEVVLNRYGDLGPFRVTLDADTFSRLIEEDVESAIKCFEDTLKKAGVSMDELGCILMVGGSVNLAPLIDRVEEKWKCDKIFPQDSDWSVATGAAKLSVNPGNYKLAETIGVVMADDSFYPLMKEGEPVDYEPIEFTFAMVEDSGTANFVFSNGCNVLGYLHVPAFGFFKEQINLKARIDRNLVFRVSAKSNRRSERYTEEWQYPGPKLYYQLPTGFGGGKGD